MRKLLSVFCQCLRFLLQTLDLLSQVVDVSFESEDLLNEVFFFLQLVLYLHFESCYVFVAALALQV